MSLVSKGLVELEGYKPPLFDQGLWYSEGDAPPPPPVPPFILGDVFALAAYEGDNPLVTGRYPQPGYCLELASAGAVSIPTSLVSTIDRNTFFLKTNYKPDNTTGDKTIFSTNLSSDPENSFLALYLENARLFAFTSDGSSVTIYDSGIDFNSGEWHKIEVELSSNIEIKVNSSTYTTPLVASINQTGNLPIELASNPCATAPGAGYATGKHSNLQFGDSSGIIGQFNLDSGDTGQAINAVNLNLSALRFGTSITTDNELPFSYLNVVGYTLNSGVRIPANPNNPGFDAAGNSLQFSGSVYPVKPVPKGSYAFIAQGGESLNTPFDLTGVTVLSNDGTSTVTVNANNTDLDFTAGSVSNVKLSNGHTYWFCEGVGTSVYCSAGPDFTGTLINITSDTNDEGFGAWRDEMFGYGFNHNQLNGFTHAFYMAGNNNYIYLDNNITTLSGVDFRYDFYADFYTGTPTHVLSNRSTGGNSALVIGPDETIVYFFDGTSNTIPHISTVLGGAQYRLERVANVVSIIIDGVTQGSFSNNSAFEINSFGAVMGSGNPYASLNGYILNVEYSRFSPGSNAWVIFNSYTGDPINSYPWDDTTGYNNGFELNASTIRIPKNPLNPTQDLEGGFLTNPGDGISMNNAENYEDGYGLTEDGDSPPEAQLLLDSQDFIQHRTLNEDMMIFDPVDATFRYCENYRKKVKYLQYTNSVLNQTDLDKILQYMDQPDFDDMDCGLGGGGGIPVDLE